MIRTHATGAGAIAVLTLLALATVARGAETEWWVVDTAAELARAEARGVVVDPEGVMSLGPRLERWNADSLSVLWALAPLPDGSIAVAGDGGRVDRWTA